MSKGGSRLKREVKCLDDEVLTLKMAIEEAIIRGQRSFGALGDTTESAVIADEELALDEANGDSGLVGWIDDL